MPDDEYPIAEKYALNNIRCAHTAEHQHGGHKGCLKGTREAVLDKIELWTRDFSQPPVYWLNGLAGTGKSTISRTIAERVFANGKLGASFFCSRDFLDRSNLQLIFPTLAVQLAHKYTRFRSILISSVQSNPRVVDESLHNQMDKLIVQPLRESAISTVIVIDALDECRDDKPASAILSVLGQFVSQIPMVKFFLTGRPEPWIHEGFQLPQMADVTDVFILHQVNPNQVDSDIQLFFRYSFSELSSQYKLGDWPSEDQLDLLCKRAAGLFSYAVATINFVGCGDNGPKEQLVRLLRSPESIVHGGRIEFEDKATLDFLYMSILQEAFGDSDPEDDSKVRSVLGAITLAVNPLSPSIIATLSGLSTNCVYLQLSSVRSLLIFKEDVNHPVLPFHKSFPDFLVDPKRCTNQRFHLSPPNHHSELLIGCLNLMNQRLEKNMCKLPDASMNDKVHNLQERAEQSVGPALQYACRSWHKHLIGIHMALGNIPKITSILHQFLEEKFLFWLEVLSILGNLRDAVNALEAAAKWLEVS